MEQNSQSGHMPDAVSEPAAKKRPLVLVVDDDPHILRLMQMIHDYLEIDLETAQTAETALELLQTNAFDAVLLDCSMPVVDGFEFATLWRKFEQQTNRKRLPIIAVTALRSEETAIKCWDAGMDAFIVKPLDVNTLKATIEQMLEGSQQQEKP
jgi:DNA-binding response OmpR family regulator